MESRATYFGKTPHHPDFVRGPGQQKLILLLDNWLSRAMERLSYQPDWKAAYDGKGALDFAFVSPASTLALIGSIRSSHDKSGRRFPFLTASSIARCDARVFRCAPSALTRSYETLSGLTHAALEGMDLNILHEELSRLDCTQDFDQGIARNPLSCFLRDTTLASLSRLLGGDNDATAVARTILAIGLVMQQLFSGRKSPVDKELELPLPPRQHEAYWQVAGLWLYLVTAFVRTPSMELQVVLEHDGLPPRMRIGLNGASASPLCTAFMGSRNDEHGLCLIDPPWVDEHLLQHTDRRLIKLATYLAQPTLSLEHILATFQEAFLKA